MKYVFEKLFKIPLGFFSSATTDIADLNPNEYQEMEFPLNYNGIMEVKETAQQIAITKEADVFLNNNSLDIYLMMIKNGYIPKPYQTEHFDEIINDLIVSSDPMVVKLIENHGFVLTPAQAELQIFSFGGGKSTSIFVDYIFKGSNMLDIINSLKDNENQLKLFNHIKPLCLSPEYQSHLVKSLQGIIADYYEENQDDEYGQIRDPKTILNNFAMLYKVIYPHSFKEIKVSEYLDMINSLKEISTDDFFEGRLGGASKKRTVEIANIIIANMTDKLHTIYDDQIKSLMDNTKVAFLTHHATQAAMDISKQKLESKFSENLLPESAISYIDDIKKVFGSIIKDQSQSDITESSNKLINEQLPIVIDKYLSMEPEYRLTMKNSQGKNAEELLLESLKSVHELLEQNLIILQQDNLSELSVNNRFLKAKVGT